MKKTRGSWGTSKLEFTRRLLSTSHPSFLLYVLKFLQGVSTSKHLLVEIVVCLTEFHIPGLCYSLLLRIPQ